MAMRRLRNQLGKTRPVSDHASDYVFRNRVPSMQAIEFEAVADQHMLRLPEQVPDGVKLRVMLLMDDGVARSLKPQGKDRPSRKPAPQLAGSVTVHDDLLAPAVPEQDGTP
jgi:hypothetical protein